MVGVLIIKVDMITAAQYDVYTTSCSNRYKHFGMYMYIEHYPPTHPHSHSHTS